MKPNPTFFLSLVTIAMNICDMNRDPGYQGRHSRVQRSTKKTARIYTKTEKNICTYTKICQNISLSPITYFPKIF